MRRVGGLRSSERLPADNRELSPPTVSQEALPTSGELRGSGEESGHLTPGFWRCKTWSGETSRPPWILTCRAVSDRFVLF